APPERFAGLRVLHRPSAPRHPPRTLCSLFFFSLSKQQDHFTDNTSMLSSIPLTYVFIGASSASLLLSAKLKFYCSVVQVQGGCPHQLKSGNQSVLWYSSQPKF